MFSNKTEFYKIRLSVFILCIISFHLYSQVPSTQGTAFWVSFMRNGVEVFDACEPWGTPALHIIVSSKKACTVTFTNPITNWTKTQAIGANTRVEVPIPNAQCYSRAVGTQSTGILVTSTDTISCYASNFVKYSFDASNVLPISVLTDEYTILDYPASGLGSSFLVIANEDNTIIDITPTVTTADGHAANITYSVTLNKGQVYHTITKCSSCQTCPSDAQDIWNFDYCPESSNLYTYSSYYSIWAYSRCEACGYLAEVGYYDPYKNSTNFSGTVVKSRDCKKIAVYSGNPGVNIPNTRNYVDHVFEQIWPIAYWGKNFVILNSYNRPSDMVRITAAENNDTIYKNGVYETVLSANQTYEFAITSLTPSCYITTTQPSAVVSYFIGSNSTSGNNLVGDPSMVWISPVEQVIDEITFGTFQPSGSVTNQHYVNVVTRTAYIDSLTLDGVSQASKFTVVTGNSDYSYARISVTHGVHTIKSSMGFVAMVYGLGIDESYSYSIGSAAVNLNRQIMINNEPNSIITSNQQYCLNIPIEFYPTAEEKIKDVVWDFGDGSSKVSATTNDTLYHTYTQYGSYDVVMILDTRMYCSDYDTIKTIVNIYDHSYSYQDSICYGKPVNFQGELISVYADTILTKVLKNNLGCDSAIICHVSVNQNYSDTLKATTCYGDGYYQYGFNIADTTPVGVVYQTQTLQTVKGCDSLKTLQLTIAPIYHSEEWDTACGKYVWNNYIFTQSCDTTIAVQTIKGCDSILTLHLTVYPAVETTFSDTACDYYIWNAQTYTSSGIYTQRFKTTQFCDSVVHCNLIIRNSYYQHYEEGVCFGQGYSKYGFTYPTTVESGVYKDTLVYQTIYGCDSILTLKLTVQSVSKSSVNVEACSSYTWNGETYTQSCDTTRIFQTQYNCDSIVSLHLQINIPKDTMFLDTACYHYQWNDKEYSSSGVYTQKYKTISGCDSVVTIHLLLIDTSITLSYIEDALCDNDYMEIEAVTEMNSFVWMLDGEAIDLMTKVIKISEGGLYRVVAQEYDCQATAQVFIEDCDFEVKFPNVFTPNGDGINDEFYPETEGVNSEEMYIYDSWGRMVYQWNKVGTQWNGSNKHGKMLPAGVYYYIYKAIGPFDKEIVKNGSITLIR